MNRRSINIKDSEKELSSEMMTHVMLAGVKEKEREEVENLEEDRPNLIKMMTPPLGCRSSRKRMPDHE